MVLPGLLSMTYQAPFYVTQDCQPRGGLNCGELGPPTSNISFLTKALQTCLQANLMAAILQLGSFSLGNSNLG